MSFLLSILSGAMISYSEPYEEGQDVDLNQGYYVCSVENPRELMMDLIEIRDDRQRRREAQNRGCPFVLSEREGPIFKVVHVSSQVCLDREYDQYSDSWSCGREGHQLVVERQSRRFVVIQLSLDVEY